MVLEKQKEYNPHNSLHFWNYLVIYAKIKEASTSNRLKELPQISEMYGVVKRIDKW